MKSQLKAGFARHGTNRLKALARACVRLLGKGDEKVAAAFGSGPEVYRVILHLRAGAPDIPIWLFATTDPMPEAAALAERVFVRRSSVAVALVAQRELWRRSVALAAGSWTGEQSSRTLKAIPLLIPPFRAVFQNANGDFLPGTSRSIALHVRRRLRDAIHSGANRAIDLGRGYWLLLSVHAWRSGPCTRAVDMGRGYWSRKSLLRWNEKAGLPAGCVKLPMRTRSAKETGHEEE